MGNRKNAAAKKKEVKPDVDPSRGVNLPEELAGLEALDEETRAKMIADYAERQKEIFEKRLKAKVESFTEKLESEGSTQAAIIVRRILMAKLKEEITNRRQAIRTLRAENKLIRQQAREDRKAAREGRKPEVIWKGNVTPSDDTEDDTDE